LSRSFDLIDRDVKLVLSPSPIVSTILDTLRDDLTCAFRLREELINMKKVAYHVHHSGTLIERSLAQLATYFRTDHADEAQDHPQKRLKQEQEQANDTTANSSYFIHSDRFTTIVDARMRCKGACHASADARAMAKQVCCLPRHPLKKRPTIMENLPNSLETFRLVRETIQTMNADESFSEAVTLAAVPNLDCSHWSSRIENALSNLAEHKDISLDVIAFVQLLVICRGADKAVRMVDEVFTAKSAISFVISQIQVLLPVLTHREDVLNKDIVDLHSELENTCPDKEPDRCNKLTDTIAAIIRKRIHYHRHFNLLTGALPHLIELVAWLGKILNIVELGHDRVMFLASDSSADRHTLPAALQVPKVEVDTMALFASYRAVESHFRPQMFHTIRTRGWPSSLQHALASSDCKEEKVADNKHCHVCERSYSCLWVHRGVCCECEDRIRQTEKRCPFRAVCKSTWFCPHSLRCLICDAHSCEDCSLERGDASLVTAVAGRICPRRIAFDFDRTLASTKSGAVPVIGKHVADVDLVSLMWKYPCVVVTRNQNKEAIQLFLAERGAPPDLEICIVGKKESKVKFILGLAAVNNTCNKDNASENINNDTHDEEGSERSSEMNMNTKTAVGDVEVDAADDVNDGPPVLFVDDSVQELVDPLVAQEASIFRILFVRSLA
jgi:hypothetical protein